MVDDNVDIFSYLASVFEKDFQVFALSGKPAEKRLLTDIEPQPSLSNIMIGDVSGLELRTPITSNPVSNTIPVVLVIASSADKIELKALNVVADNYVDKPFDEERLLAHVHSLIQNKKPSFNDVNKKSQQEHADHKISRKQNEFIEKVTHIVEEHLDDPKFSVQMLAEAISMSYSNFYRRIKSICGKSANEFIRLVRLRKVAQLLIETEYNVSEAAFAAGFNDIKYFRAKFLKLYGMKPSEYKKKYEVLKKENRLTMQG